MGQRGWRDRPRLPNVGPPRPCAGPPLAFAVGHTVQLGLIVSPSFQPRNW